MRPCASAWLDTSIVRAVQPISSPRARLEYTSSGEGVVLSISTNSSSIIMPVVPILHVFIPAS